MTRDKKTHSGRQRKTVHSRSWVFSCEVRGQFVHKNKISSQMWSEVLRSALHIIKIPAFLVSAVLLRRFQGNTYEATSCLLGREQ